MAHGATDSKVVSEFEAKGLSLDRKTAKQLRSELKDLPSEMVDDLSDAIRPYWASLTSKVVAFLDKPILGMTGVSSQETPAHTGKTEARASVEEVTPLGSPSAGVRVKNPVAESFRERFAEIQDAYSGALDRQMREALNIQPLARPQQSPDSLTLNVVSHKLPRSRDRFGVYYLSLIPSVEVNAAQYVRVSECALFIGGEPISEYVPRQRELLGEDTWLPYFKVPEWVRPGTYKICIGALLAKADKQRFIARFEGKEDKYVKSNEFEVSIPILPKVDAAKVAAKKRKMFG
ncbi:MAG: hypothetical protein Q7K03_10310 [Dehalococcoidia bacterium]|nr:hypothetical protein [Dehalococcoidia bacterium]